MPRFKLDQEIGQLDKRKGGYYYLKVDAEIVNQFEKKRATRLICVIDDKISYSCGLNHLGDGNFFLIVATAKLKQLNKSLGDWVAVDIYEDPNPLGVEEPEVLKVLLEQDSDAKKRYDALSDGKKRSLIYSIIKVKNIDLQVQKILTFLESTG